MDPGKPVAQRYRFGLFEVDRRSGELRKNGTKVKLQEQPFQILLTLLERPGEVVTRDELRHKLWSESTFVDFDQSLGTAIRKIREALGDSANNPRFVETLPGRGYRFIGSVESPSKAEPGRASHTAPLAPPPVSRKWWYAGAAVLAVGLALGAVPALRFFFPRATEPLVAVPFTSYEGSESYPGFSPEGNQVAFSWNGENQDNVDVYVKTVGPGSPLRLTTNPGRDYAPAWSPDGRQITFYRDSGEKQTIYSIPPLGGPERKLAEIPGLFSRVGPMVWSPDAKSLLISTSHSPNEPESIHQLSIDTGERRRLIAPPTRVWRGHFYPAVSPDGRTLAFVRIASGRSAILLSPLGGGEPEEITIFEGFIEGLAWAPDGQDVVVSVGGGQQTELPNRLWRVPISGGAARPLAGVGERGRYPAISPQKGRLVYERRLDEWNIWRYHLSGASADAGRPEKLIASTQNDYAPQVSPDGKRIAFQSGRSGNLEIWVCDRDGSNPVQLTSLAGPEPGMPKWSPDGSYVAFDCPLEGEFDVFVISSEGGSPRQLTTYSGQDSRPNWSRDGRWIYFGSERSGEFQIWKVPAEGGDPAQITRGGGSHPVESPDGEFVYYGKSKLVDGLWKAPVGGGEEVAVLRSLKDAGLRGWWDVVDDGIYFVDAEEDASSKQKWSLEFFHFETQQVTRVADLEKPPASAGALDISPDGQWCLYARVDQSSSDLMLVENFR